jgi:spermidine/putrescine transport system permease protein
VLVLVLSFWKRDSYGTLIPAFTADNYVRFFDSLYIGIFVDTLVLGAVTTVLCLLIGYPLAYYMTVVPPRWQKVLLVLVMVPFWVNFLIRSYAWILLLRSQGIINSLLEALGWIDEPLTLLYTTGAVYVGMVYTLIPFMVLPIYASLEKRDRTLLEAAADLGATPAQAFWRITVPQTSSGTTAGCIIVFVSAMGMFVVSDVLGGAKSAMYSNIIQNQFLSARDWPFGAALSVLFIIFSLIMIVLYQRAARTAREGGEGHA